MGIPFTSYQMRHFMAADIIKQILGTFFSNPFESGHHLPDTHTVTLNHIWDLLSDTESVGRSDGVTLGWAGETLSVQILFPAQILSYRAPNWYQLSSHWVGVICRPWKWPIVRALGVVLALINVWLSRWNDCFQCVVPLLKTAECTYTPIKKTLIRGFSISFAIVLSLRAFLWIWVRAAVFHPPPWMTMGGITAQTK